MAVRKTSTSKFITILASCGGLALLLWLIYQAADLSNQDELEIMGIIPEQNVQQAFIEEPEIPTATIPEPLQETTSEVDLEVEPQPENTAITLPGLDDSDNFFRDLLLTEKNTATLRAWLEREDLIRRSASYIDGLARGSLLGKIFPLNAPEGQFTTHRQADVIWLNAGNYERYNNTVNVLMALDMQQMAQIFHLIRPLLESAFAELGYQPRQMDGIILQSIDNILATPVIVEPLQLVRESVAYKFADPELEALLPLQKQLLRAGPENTQRLQQQAMALREALLNP